MKETSLQCRLSKCVSFFKLLFFYYLLKMVHWSPWDATNYLGITLKLLYFCSAFFFLTYWLDWFLEHFSTQFEYSMHLLLHTPFPPYKHWYRTVSYGTGKSLSFHLVHTIFKSRMGNRAFSFLFCGKHSQFGFGRQTCTFFLHIYLLVLTIFT